MTIKEQIWVITCCNRNIFAGSDGLAEHAYTVVYCIRPVSAPLGAEARLNGRPDSDELLLTGAKGRKANGVRSTHKERACD